jgi:hypothetical protein
MRLVGSKSLDEVRRRPANFSGISIVLDLLHMDESARRAGDEIG